MIYNSINLFWLIPWSRAILPLPPPFLTLQISNVPKFLLLQRSEHIKQNGLSKVLIIGIGPGDTFSPFDKICFLKKLFSVSCCEYSILANILI